MLHITPFLLHFHYNINLIKKVVETGVKFNQYNNILFFLKYLDKARFNEKSNKEIVNILRTSIRNNRSDSRDWDKLANMKDLSQIRQIYTDLSITNNLIHSGNKGKKTTPNFFPQTMLATEKDNRTNRRQEFNHPPRHQSRNGPVNQHANMTRF